MLRIAVARGSACAAQAGRATIRRQWQPQRIQQPLQRAFADDKPVDKNTIPIPPGEPTAGVPTGPISAPIAASNIPKPPPTPAETASKTPSTSTLPPTGTGTASTGPAAAPPPKKPRRRVRNFFLTLAILSALGYAGGVYYSLVSDNFHDFFTEYIPFGEDAVAYFEEREFRRRFPTTPQSSAKAAPQPRGEHKVTIGRSGLTPRESGNAGADLATKGRHVSAVEDNKAAAKQDKTAEPQKPTPKETGKATAPPSKDTAAAMKQEAQKEAKKEAQSAAPKPKEAAAAAPKPVESKPTPPPTPSVDHINVPEATEPVVQDVVKILNNIIAAVNSSPDASKYASTLSNAKDELSNVIKNITTLKDKAAQDADKKVTDAHTEFDQAAKELVRRLEGEMKEQEVKWRDEYESEREKLSTSYQQRLAAELDAAKKLADEKTQNSLLEQEIVLQKKYMDSVQSSVEAERSGRLAKLDELSSSVDELQKLTSEWNSVVDATLQTQHLQVAIEAVRSKIQASDLPTPFLNELVALKEVSADSPLVTAAIASINPHAYQLGIASPAHLIDRFRRVASEVRKASLLPEDAGVASHAASAVLSRLMFQKKSDRGLPEGEDVEATLARTEVLLEEGDLDAAAREMNNLKGWAGVLSRDWVVEVRRVLEVKQAVDVIGTEARLQSLLVD